MKKVIDEFEAIVIENSSDIIIRQIRKLIKDGLLKPGDKLPSEADLQHKFQVKRGVVREALRKLEFYGILRTIPQSGTFVAELGHRALEGLLTNILQLEKDDHESLIDTRMVLEGHAAFLAASRSDKLFISEMQELQSSFENKIKAGDRGINEDICLHLKIAEASCSSILCSLITIISPDILYVFNRLNKTTDARLNKTLIEHRGIIQAIEDGKPKEAESKMRKHITKGYDSSRALGSA